MSYGNGYFIYVGPNADASTQRAIASGLSPEQLYIMMVSRYVWVDNVSGGINRKRFIKDYSLAKRYQIMPMALKDKSGAYTENNMDIGWDLALNMTKLEIISGDNLTKNNMRYAVLEKAKDEM